MSARAEQRNRLPEFVGSLVDPAQLVREIDEPLRRSAPVMFELAQHNCVPTTEVEDCQAFHAVWQYMRQADTSQRDRIEGPIFAAAAEWLARAGRLERALVSAAADYSMLAHLAYGARRAGALPVFDVVDHCKTALAINAWYGTERALRVRTFHSDVFAFQPDSRYDLICTHSFLHWHPLEDRARLFRLWREWLAPGGYLCICDRILPEPVPFGQSKRHRRVDELRSRIPEQLATLGIPLPRPEDEFKGWVERFCFHRHIGQPAMPMDLIEQWIADAGLVLESAVPVAKLLPAEKDTPLSADSDPRRPRMCFLIRRPL